MIDIKKLKVIKITRQKKLDTTKDKNNLIDLFNEQIKKYSTLSKITLKNCQNTSFKFKMKRTN